jgi:GNAT superfamily N-acetyltransferase
MDRSVVSEIEEALVGHWSHFGRWPEGRLIEAEGTLRYETPIPQLPYNGVIRTVIERDPELVVARVLDSFRSRGVSCLWWDHPTTSPADLSRLLTAHGLSAVERVAGMSIDISERPIAPMATAGIRYHEVLDDAAMNSYSDLIVRYWELPEESRSLVDAVNRYWGPGKAPVHRWVAFDKNDRAIGKVLLSLAAPAGVAAIYGMSVRPEFRGRGVASALTQIVLQRANAEGCSRVVLHSSEMAVKVYEHAGFTKQCDLTVYADAPLWASRHH